jgi:hypothetical protein
MRRAEWLIRLIRFDPRRNLFWAQSRLTSLPQRTHATCVPDVPLCGSDVSHDCIGQTHRTQIGAVKSRLEQRHDLSAVSAFIRVEGSSMRPSRLTSLPQGICAACVPDMAVRCSPCYTADAITLINWERCCRWESRSENLSIAFMGRNGFAAHCDSMRDRPTSWRAKSRRPWNCGGSSCAELFDSRRLDQGTYGRVNEHQRCTDNAQLAGNFNGWSQPCLCRKTCRGVCRPACRLQDVGGVFHQRNCADIQCGFEVDSGAGKSVLFEACHRFKRRTSGLGRW